MTTLKALSIRQPYAEEILLGEKTIEYRSWHTKHRGALLIHASKNREEDGHEGLPLGCLVGMVRLVAIDRDGEDYAWALGSPVRFAEPIPSKGAVGLLNVPWDLVKDVELLLPDGTPAGETPAAYLASTGVVVA